jgi:hypothetical protein
MYSTKLLLAASVAALSACATGSKEEKLPNQPAPTAGERLDETRRGIGNAFVSPLRDVGIVKTEVPRVLDDIKYPYRVGALVNGCAQVSYEIGALDALLGPESYAPQGGKSLGTRGVDAVQNAGIDAAESFTSDFIPFRSWVRKASGAEKADKEAARAIEMGQTRRSFLRGYGAAMGCNDVLPPGPKGETEAATQMRQTVSGAGAPP